MQPSGPRWEGWGRKQGKHLSRALKTLGVDLKRNLLVCRNAPYSASCGAAWQMSRTTEASPACPRVPPEHSTDNSLCAPPPGASTASLPGEDRPLECPHNSQTTPPAYPGGYAEQEADRRERVS